MERLTQKHDLFDYVLPEQNIVGDNQATEISLGETEYTCKKYIVGEAIKKLGELEDVLEKYNIKNIEDLELRLEDIEHYAYQTNKQLIDILAKYGIENLDILDLNLQTIKNINIQNANLRNELAEIKQKAIVLKFKVGQKVYVIENKHIFKDVVEEIEITEDGILFYFEEGIYGLEENEIFATKKEAEQKLAEIKGEKDD